MSITSIDVGMISKRQPHPAHVGFGEAVGADLINIRPIGPSGSFLEDVLTGFKLRPVNDKDMYILEDVSMLYGLPFLTHQSDPTVILLATSHRTNGSSYDFQLRNVPTDTARWVDRRIDAACQRWLVPRCVDGIIANSDLSAQSMRHIAHNLPIRVVEPYIQPSVYEQLQSIEPSLGGTTAVFVGEGREHKGVDLLVEAWPLVRQRVPEATLELVGRGHTDAHSQVGGVTVRGYVKDLSKVFVAASLYVHPARYEPWGVAPVEAMLAGVPPIVTDETGAAPLVAQIDNRLVTSPTPEALAEIVTWYFRLREKKKQQFSAKARELARPYNERAQTEAFVEEFNSLIDSITEP